MLGKFFPVILRKKFSKPSDTHPPPPEKADFGLNLPIFWKFWDRKMVEKSKFSKITEKVKKCYFCTGNISLVENEVFGTSKNSILAKKYIKNWNIWKKFGKFFPDFGGKKFSKPLTHPPTPPRNITGKNFPSTPWWGGV